MSTGSLVVRLRPRRPAPSDGSALHSASRSGPVPRGVELLFLFVGILLGLVGGRTNSSVVRTAGAAEPWQERLAARIARHPGEAAVAVAHLESGARFQHRADEPFPTASLIKLPVLIEAYRQAESGRLSLDAPVELRDADKVPGSGILTPHFSAGARFPLRDALRMMIAWSDNTATNLVVERIGLEATTAAMRELGCPETRLHSLVFRRDTSLDPQRSRRFGLGSTTAGEMLRLLEKLHRRELVSPAASDAIRRHLAACQDRSMLPRDLPPEAQIAHKTGGVTGVRTDAGLIVGPAGTLAVCVLTRANRTPPGAAVDPGEDLCADVARLAFEHFHPPERLAAARRSPRLAVGASGPAVVELQERLRRVLPADVELAVDGEFGPQTEAAVKAFQRLQKMTPQGVVDEAVWQALRGP